MSKSTCIIAGLLVSATLAAKGISDSRRVPCDAQAGVMLRERAAAEAKQPASTIATVVAAKPRDSRPTTIQWVTPAEAAASPKPDWWHVSDPVVGRCAPCLRAEAIFRELPIVRWSEAFDCVRADTVGGRVPPVYPLDIFTSADGRAFVRQNGCPPDARAYKWRLYRAYEKVKRGLP